MLINPNKVIRDNALSVFELSSTIFPTAISPKYINRRINSVVSLASQTQYVPHVGLPHNEPVTNAKVVIQAPVGSEARNMTAETSVRQIQ